MAANVVSLSGKLKPGMAGVTETMLLTVGARAVDAASTRPLLNDQWAKEVLDRIDYDPALNEGFIHVVVLRARLLDAWAAEFLDTNPDATVLQLACGLDSRALRLSPGRRVRWIDVDLPEVVELRQKLFTAPPPGDYILMASSVLERAWLDRIPTDRPVLVIMEGLVPYLHLADVETLFQRLCDRFPQGQIIFDAIGKLHMRLQAWRGPVHKTGAQYHTAIDDAQQLVKVHQNLAVRSVLQLRQFPGMELAPIRMRFFAWLAGWIPGLKTYFSAHRYTFGSASDNL